MNVGKTLFAQVMEYVSWRMMIRCKPSVWCWRKWTKSKRSRALISEVHCAEQLALLRHDIRCNARGYGSFESYTLRYAAPMLFCE
jgi:hypothetical protein